MFGGPTEINVGNYSVNGSASGSNHGSNGQNGSSTALNVGATNMEGDNGGAGNSGVGTISGKGSGEDRLAQREAALTKFRQKRKERCFEKKVTKQALTMHVFSWREYSSILHHPTSDSVSFRSRTFLGYKKKGLGV